MIAYVDSSIVVRALLHDEPEHRAAEQLVVGGTHTLVTGSWTIIETTGALVRAGRAGRLPDVDARVSFLDELFGDRGPIATVHAPQAAIEDTALRLVRTHGLRAMDAWHLSVAHLTLRAIAEPGQALAFASRDAHQATVAADLGLTPI